ncbi:MAG: rod shape-determining protein MreD [Candidatus Cloacimonadaceae bacterium]|jgi:cell shape-determining protein MreD
MILRGIWSWFFGLIFLYIQIMLMPAISIAEWIPNILLPWAVFMIWTRPRDMALIVSFIIMTMYDTTQPALFGYSPLLFLIIGLSISEVRKPFEAESKAAMMISLVMANLIWFLSLWLALGITYGFSLRLATMNLIAFIYNLVISFVVFWLLYYASRLRLVRVDE